METKTDQCELEWKTIHIKLLGELPEQYTPLVAQNGRLDVDSLRKYGIVLQGYAYATKTTPSRVMKVLAQLGYKNIEVTTGTGSYNAVPRDGHYYQFEEDFDYLLHVNGGPLLKDTVASDYTPPVDRSKVAMLLSLVKAYNHY